MKCFHECPRHCARECKYVRQPHVQRPPTRREYWLVAALVLLVLLLSLLPR